MSKNKSTVSARDLQQPGSELWRHDLSVHYFLQHPCMIEVFNSQLDACTTEDEENDVIYQWWIDSVPAYVRYSNRTGKDAPRSRFERNHVRIARAAATLRIGGAL